MDLTLTTNTGFFNYRVGAVILFEDKILMVKDPHGYYYSVGGRVHFGEFSEEAILREVREEIGISLEIDRLAFIHKNFFTADFAENLPFHEIALFYLMKPSQHLQHFEKTGLNPSLFWLPIKELSQLNVYPDFFQTELADLSKACKHFLTKENCTVLCL